MSPARLEDICSKQLLLCLYQSGIVKVEFKALEPGATPPNDAPGEGKVRGRCSALLVASRATE
jgi:hypothetical protein